MLGTTSTAETHRADLNLDRILLAEPVAGPPSMEELRPMGIFWTATSRGFPGHPLAVVELSCHVKRRPFHHDYTEFSNQ
jgi:hypothetical protein